MSDMQRKQVWVMVITKTMREKQRWLLLLDYLTVLTPSKSPPVCRSAPSGMNCPEEHQVSVRIFSGRRVFVLGSNKTECAVQSWGRTRSLLSLQVPSVQEQAI